MKTYSRIDQFKLKDRFIQSIMPEFIKNIPQKVKNWCNAVPMEICLLLLMMTTITATSIQQATLLLSDAILADSNRALQRFAKKYIPEIPHPNRVRHTLKLWTPHQINTKYRDINFKLIRQMKKGKLFKQTHGKKKGIAVAFDLTEKGYYGSKNQFTSFTKGRSPAKLCHSYLTIQMVCPGMRFILDQEPVYTDGKSLDVLMAKLLKRVKAKTGLKIATIYLDRGFYQTDILKYLRYRFSGNVLMPVIRTSRVKTAIKEWHEQHGYTAGEMELVIGSKKKAQQYILIFAPLSEEYRAKWRKKKKANPEEIHNDFLYFCLLKSPDQLLKDEYSYQEIFTILSEEYRRRWGIETGYRVYKDIWGKTSSQSYSLRYWLMWNAVMVYNLWILENLELIENGDKLIDNYSCCETPSLEEIEEGKKLRKSRKYPGWSRVTDEFPARKWTPIPIEPLRELCDSFKKIIVAMMKDWILTGCDPPSERKEKSTSS
ncbi:MAG: hypothetical protein HeimC2_41130 [Candidatus Heimdallarchaeota archaeon LC_2]|nr:MAG: hypothetical protein HeimC2_41130 [Candidatus Heimdallarchaeota archaeon LC_2]